MPSGILEVQLVEEKNDSFDRDFEETLNKIQAQLETLAENTANYMRTYISGHKKRPGGQSILERNINVSLSKNNKYEYAFVIGDIKKLNKVAPYWFVLNYGFVAASKNPESMAQGETGAKFIPPRTIGTFNGRKPDPSMRGSGKERFTHSSADTKRKYILNPTTFRPINYIERASAYLSRNFNKLK